MPYSVSPRVRDHSVGPKPTMNCGTRMPNLPGPDEVPELVEPDREQQADREGDDPEDREKDPAQLQPPADDAAGVLPGPLLRGQHVLDAGRCAEVRRVVEGTRDEVHDAPERQATRDERRDRLLVGGVEQRRDDATGLPGRAGPAGPPGRRRRRAGRTPRCWPSTSPARGWTCGQPVGPGQGQRDRQPHVRRAGLGDRRAVGEGDHRVHDRLRVHHDVDVGVGDAEEQVRLDQLEPLVDQGRRVDRDDRAHVPGGVRQRLVHA